MASASSIEPRSEASRIGIRRASGATPEAPFSPAAQATPAQAVPWSSWLPGRGSSVRSLMSRGATILPGAANSSWSTSTPSSITAIVTPAPRASRQARTTFAWASMRWPETRAGWRCHC